MATVQTWTGRETVILRAALRMSVRGFAEHLGIGVRTVANWESKSAGIQPLPDMQAILDTALAQSSNAARERFATGLAGSISRPGRFETVEHVLGLPALPLSAAAAPAEFLALASAPTEGVDEDFLDAVRTDITRIVELDNRFGGADLARLAVRFFRKLREVLGNGNYEARLTRDVQAAVGELAEVAGWLLYDADCQDGVRRLNQEALYFSRLAGDRSVELLTLQNMSMHAGYLGRPNEALQVAESVLESRDQLPPRVRALFTVRKARALAQAGNGGAAELFEQVRTVHLDGIRHDDPSWTWWVDERELAWHEGMALRDLGRPHEAVAFFQRSVAATPDQQIRSRYLHLGYLLGAQVDVRAWHEAEATMLDIVPLIAEVASTRTAVLLDGAVRRVQQSAAPSSTREMSEQLGFALTAASS